MPLTRTRFANLFFPMLLGLSLLAQETVISRRIETAVAMPGDFMAAH